MANSKSLTATFAFWFAILCSTTSAQLSETLPPLKDNKAPFSFEEMWEGFDPRKEPLETEVLHEFEQDGVVMKVLRFRIGVFKGQKAKLAAIYGYPKSTQESGRKIPGLLQIHGGGQYANSNACLKNAKRGYATLSISWAGRISAPDYTVNPEVVKLFWEGKTNDPNYRLTTDWGALDAYHAPSRHKTTTFPSARPSDWTLDEIESPRNCPWFLCALAARRGLTFLERQPEVDPDRLGVYGHSMGGKLTIMTASDERVKAAAPSCGGISDRQNESELFRATVGDDANLKKVSCPVMFLSPANDFHGRISDLKQSVTEINGTWRLTCAPHHNHQDTADYEVATLLWFDQHLKQTFEMPKTPVGSLVLNHSDSIPRFLFRVDDRHKILGVDVFYTQHGKDLETRFDMQNTVSRFWHHSQPTKMNDQWVAKLPIATNDKPLWVYANVKYALDQTVSGAGYYYGDYETKSFVLSSLMSRATPDELSTANTKATLAASSLIEDFLEDWNKEWFSYRPSQWAISTHKVYDQTWAAPPKARLHVEVQSEQPNRLVILIDQHAAEVELQGGDSWESVELALDDFKDFAGATLPTWKGIKTLKLSELERLRGGKSESRIVGKRWQGAAPKFRILKWIEEK